MADQFKQVLTDDTGSGGYEKVSSDQEAAAVQRERCEVV